MVGYPLYSILLPFGYPPICGRYPACWILRLVGIRQLPAGNPIHMIHFPLGILQLDDGIRPLGLINNPISWTRNRREDMAAEAGGS